jgi:hypothetical protein
LSRGKCGRKGRKEEEGSNRKLHSG